MTDDDTSATDDAPATRQGIRSYVLRQGRMTGAQRNAVDALWNRFGLDSSSGAIDFAREFPGRDRRVLEIGFGMGHTLFELATRETATAFIGIEVHRPGVGTLLMQGAEAGLQNLRVYCEDALIVLADAVPESSLDEVLLFFPDPWHKKRHHKRRIVQPAFADLVRSRLKPGGILHMATDWADYAEHMLAVMDAAPGWENLAGAGNCSPRPASRPETKFERRGLRLGHEVRDLRYRRRD